jgi:hypothetical protein
MHREQHSGCSTERDATFSIISDTPLTISKFKTQYYGLNNVKEEVPADGARRNGFGQTASQTASQIAAGQQQLVSQSTAASQKTI